MITDSDTVTDTAGLKTAEPVLSNLSVRLKPPSKRATIKNMLAEYFSDHHLDFSNPPPGRIMGSGKSVSHHATGQRGPAGCSTI